LKNKQQQGAEDNKSKKTANAKKEDEKSEQQQQQQKSSNNIANRSTQEEIRKPLELSKSSNSVVTEDNLKKTNLEHVNNIENNNGELNPMNSLLKQEPEKHHQTLHKQTVHEISQNNNGDPSIMADSISLSSINQVILKNIYLKIYANLF
jgi:hypothetical protein